MNVKMMLSLKCLFVFISVIKLNVKLCMHECHCLITNRVISIYKKKLIINIMLLFFLLSYSLSWSQ